MSIRGWKGAFRKALTLLEALLHMGLILEVEEVEAGLAEELRRRVAQQAHHSLVDEGELSLHRVPGYELRVVVRAGEIARVWS